MPNRDGILKVFLSSHIYYHVNVKRQSCSERVEREGEEDSERRGGR